MGFLGDVFEAIGDLAEILVEGGVELHQIVRDTGNDIAEATVQQVKNTLNGEGDKGIRTSYDIRDEAKERISKINREYRDTKDDFHQTWEKIKSYYYEVSKMRYRV